MCTDFSDYLCWSDTDDDLEQIAASKHGDVDATSEHSDGHATSEYSDEHVTSDHNNPVTSTVVLTSDEPPNMEQPFDAVGYAIIGDNIDKNVRPSYQRQDRTTQSLHYFHSYALKNRINICEMSDKRPDSIDLSPTNILPNQSDVKKMIEEYEIFVSRFACVWSYLDFKYAISLSRVLVQHMSEFHGEKDMVTWHIPFTFSKEMSHKSEVVGIKSYISMFKFTFIIRYHWESY